jgi:hypothetical protein
MQPADVVPCISVLMPTYDHAAFILRAIESLRAQTFAEWELVIVNDGSPDDTEQKVAPTLSDPRIQYHRLANNIGLGAALNYALDHARGEYIAYLPSDDVYYPEHLASLLPHIERDAHAVLAFSSIRHRYNKYADGQIDGKSLQLVQVLHRRTEDRWLTRDDLVSDDLERIFWFKLRSQGAFVHTDEVTCEWVDHPHQLHKIILEPLGGINPYRSRYQVQQPLRFHSSIGNPIDEIGRYRPFRERPDTPFAADGLKILLVGELAYNAERVLALEEAGHKLYGLWTPEPYWFTTVGPLPFGHVEELPRNDWQAAIRRIKPDIIYAQLNWQTVKFCHHVMHENPGVPFVWHFKEGPFICLEKGIWRELVELTTLSDAQIYSSPEMQDWFALTVPASADSPLTMVLDGDLPKRDWFQQERSPRLSDEDGELHTVVAGRPIGLHPWTVGELAEQRIHLHFYGDFTQGQWVTWIEKANQVANGHLHLHPNVDQENWVTELSKYDAGWLHRFESRNGGDIRRADWDDLNYPARIATVAMAGLPFLQYDNRDSIVAMQTLARRFDTGIFFRNMGQLREQLLDKPRVEEIRENVWRQRDFWMFDSHVGELVEFFRKVIAAHAEKG